MYYDSAGGGVLALLVDEGRAGRLSVLLAFALVVEDVEVGSLLCLGRRRSVVISLSPFRAPERPVGGAASTGKLGETFRGNRGFPFTLEASAYGKGLEHARWVLLGES
jgi:hypothetical protein